MRSETRTRLNNVETVLDDRSDRIRELEDDITVLYKVLELTGWTTDAILDRVEALESDLADTDLLAKLAASVLSSERTRKAREDRAKSPGIIDQEPTVIQSRVCDCCTQKAPPPDFVGYEEGTL